MTSYGVITFSGYNFTSIDLGNYCYCGSSCAQSICVYNFPCGAAHSPYCWCKISYTGPTSIGAGTLNYFADFCSTNSFIGGGCGNIVCGGNSCGTFIGGGCGNIAIGGQTTIGGGYRNCACGTYSSVGGGFCNTSCGSYSTVSGGYQNLARDYSTVAGGKLNNACGHGSTVAGGFCSTASGHYSFIGGGKMNTASGSYSAVLGGISNTVSGGCSGVFGYNITNSIAGSFAANQLWACNLVGTTVAVCVGTNGLLVRGASDVRLKTNICNLPYGLCDVKKLNPVSFDWNVEERETRGCNRQIGFIAQEVEPIIPEAVGQQADNGEYSLSPDKIIPVLTKGIQELLARVELLEEIIKRNNLV
jgi:hypothetical protein